MSSFITERTSCLYLPILKPQYVVEAMHSVLIQLSPVLETLQGNIIILIPAATHLASRGILHSEFDRKKLPWIFLIS